MAVNLKSYVRSEAILRRQGWSRHTLARKIKAGKFIAPAMELDGVRYWSAAAYATWQNEQEANSVARPRTPPMRAPHAAEQVAA